MTDTRYAAGQVLDGRTICGAKKKNFDPCEASPLKGQPDVSVMAVQAPKRRQRRLESSMRRQRGSLNHDCGDDRLGSCPTRLHTRSRMMLQEKVEAINRSCRTQVLKGAYKTGTGETALWRIPPAAIDHYQKTQPRY